MTRTVNSGVAHGEHDAVIDDDPHALLFGSDEDERGYEPPLADGIRGSHGPAPTGAPLSRSASRRAYREQAREQRRRHGRRGLLAAALVVLVAVAGVVWFVVKPMYDNRYHPKDYAGTGTGTVQVHVEAGDDAKAIASTLVRAGVVASTRAFTNAAADNPDSQNIAPGYYNLRHQMQASAAVSLLLDPAAHVTISVLVPEGATSMTVATSLAKALDVSPARVQQALRNTSGLGLPTTYTVAGGVPSSAEGFLYPATYKFDPNTAPSDALAQMVAAFIEQDRATAFAGSAPANRLSAYQALIIASIAQSEAKYPADMAKVARVILNRLSQHRPLQVDATSAYGAKVEGLDPMKVDYATLVSPYNSYVHAGLPPTPISNPGADALAAAAKPTVGNWLYYVNADAAGHLFFTNDPAAFTAAQLKCFQHNWGCAAP